MHICDNLKILGVDTAGAFAEYVVAPAICAWPLDEDWPDELGTMLEPMGNAVYATLVEPVENKTVVIFGCGPTGLFSIRVARAGKAKRIISVDIDKNRREMAAELGADIVIDGADPGLVRKLKEECDGAGPEVVLEMSGAPLAIKAGLDAIQKGGRFTAFGIPAEPVTLNYAEEIILNGVRILGIVGRHMFNTWERMTDLIRAGKLDPMPVVTHRFQLEEFEKAIELLQKKESKCGKIIIYPSKQ